MRQNRKIESHAPQHGPRTLILALAGKCEYPAQVGCGDKVDRPAQGPGPNDLLLGDRLVDIIGRQVLGPLPDGPEGAAKILRLYRAEPFHNLEDGGGRGASQELFLAADQGKIGHGGGSGSWRY